MHLQKTTTAEETLERKNAFEAYTNSHGMAVRAYHADNRIFQAHKWVDFCITARQGLMFAGVNLHHENGNQKENKRVAGSGKDDADPRETLMGNASQCSPVAVYSQDGKQSGKQHPKDAKPGQEIANATVCKDQNANERQGLAPFWITCVCVGE
jgi:hypothetical protein